MVKILAALSILNSSGTSPGTTEKVAALVARATCSGASHSSGYSHSRKLDLPVTHSSPLSMWLIVLFFFPFPAKITLSGHGSGFRWWRRQHCQCNCPTPIIVCVLYCKHQIVYGFSLAHFLWLPEASASGCGDKPWPESSCTCCLQNTL